MYKKNAIHKFFLKKVNESSFLSTQTIGLVELYRTTIGNVDPLKLLYTNVL